MTKKYLLTLLLLMLLLVSKAYSADMKNAYVYSEDENLECGISYPAEVASAESVLRQNNIKVVQPGVGVVNFYINIASFDLGNGCTAYVQLHASVYQAVKIPSIKREPIPAKVLLCEFGHLMAGSKQSVGTRVHEKIRSFTEMCISNIEKQ